MKRILVAMVMALVGTAVAAPPCWACSCAPSTPKQKAESADVVFTGKVLKITGGDTSNGSYGDDNVKVRFRVGKVYKGNPRRHTKVFTNESGAACGYHFKKGEKYTVFADRHNNGTKHTNLCSGTKKGSIDPDTYGLPEGHPPRD
jgi:hypothetical protein